MFNLVRKIYVLLQKSHKRKIKIYTDRRPYFFQVPTPCVAIASMIMPQLWIFGAMNVGKSLMIRNFAINGSVFIGKWLTFTVKLTNALS